MSGFVRATKPRTSPKPKRALRELGVVESPAAPASESKSCCGPECCA